MHKLQNPAYSPLKLGGDQRLTSSLQRIGQTDDAYLQNRDRELNDILRQREAMLIEQKMLNKPMEERVNEWIIDFLNLVFGVDEETRQFWKEVLLPEVHVYYSYRLQDLYDYERNLNALYFALIEQLNLKVSEKESAHDTPTHAEAMNHRGRKGNARGDHHHNDPLFNKAGK